MSSADQRTPFDGSTAGLSSERSHTLKEAIDAINAQSDGSSNNANNTDTTPDMSSASPEPSQETVSEFDRLRKELLNLLEGNSRLRQDVLGTNDDPNKGPVKAKKLLLDGAGLAEAERMALDDGLDPISWSDFIREVRVKAEAAGSEAQDASD